MVTIDLFVPMKKEFGHFYMASQFLMDCLRSVNVGSAEK